jgi:hypothetical protein
MSHVDNQKYGLEQPAPRQSVPSVTETHKGAIKSTVYLTEINEGTGALEQELNE